MTFEFVDILWHLKKCWFSLIEWNYWDVKLIAMKRFPVKIPEIFIDTLFRPGGVRAWILDSTSLNAHGSRPGFDSRLRQGRQVHQAVIGTGFIVVIMLGGFRVLDSHYSASRSVTAMSTAIRNEWDLAYQAIIISAWYSSRSKESR
jgi:hypothetical protein